MPISNVMAVNLKVLVTTLIALIIASSGIAAFIHFSADQSRYTVPSLSELSAGTHITITRNAMKMLGGGMIVNFQTNGYYAYEYNIDLKNYSIITGSWTSTGKSLVWLMVDGMAYMDTPMPQVTNGTLNQTLVAGNYTLVIGGYPGDVISLINPIKIGEYKPHQIGNFSISAGTNISTGTSYHFYLSQPGQIVGTVTTPPGEYSFSLENSSGIGFGFASLNSSAQSSSATFSIGPYWQILSPGHYNMTFSGAFHVTQKIEFLYYYDYST